jgi:hypothetical protein
MNCDKQNLVLLSAKKTGCCSVAQWLCSSKTPSDDPFNIQPFQINTGMNALASAPQSAATATPNAGV